MILTRSHADCDLRGWGMRLREKIGLKRAAVAVARKLAVIMHAMLRSGELFTKKIAIRLTHELDSAYSVTRRLCRDVG